MNVSQLSLSLIIARLVTADNFEKNYLMGYKEHYVASKLYVLQTYRAPMHWFILQISQRPQLSKESGNSTPVSYLGGRDPKTTWVVY